MNFLKFWLSIFFSVAIGFIQAQNFSIKGYPQNYFIWPVGAKASIVANFGELRPNHYHMGLDCRTDQHENAPIYAAASGYVAKVKIEPYGFGRCIYINHPNGLTTVYAHLNTFEPDLEKYVKEQQYKLQQWKVFLDIPANLFKVNQGEYIAASGNTGGSQGPHLHFEVRDTKSDKCLNGLMFGLPIEDNIAPNIIRLALYDRTKSTYNQTPKIYMLKNNNGVYTVVGGKIIAPSGKVSFAITSFDRYTGSSNQNGIYAAAVLDNETQISKFEIDSISYAETRYLNAHIDHKVRSNGGPWLQHLSPLPGYENYIYKTDNNNGVVMLKDSETHHIKIVVSDANKNVATIKFDLANGISFAKSEIKSTQKFIPNYVNIFENSKVHFYLPENALYDTVNFEYQEIKATDGKTIYQLHHADVPVQSMYPISIKENFAIEDSGKIVMERFYGSKKDFAKAIYNKGWYTASFREFGNFRLLIDKEPPTIVPIGFKDGMNTAALKRILFKVKDNTEDIVNFTALLDGNWLRFSNDKGINFIYNFDERCQPGEHELKIYATDQVGNVAERVYKFSR
ncbi:MAG: M23 family metallopeptidase [Ferruginibacter sp.]|nr:M23 family metallopeptidase [Ferruginibacter sp.]